MKKTAFVLPLLALLACSKEVDLKLPPVESRLTIDARISTGDSILILVGTSAPMIGTADAAADSLSKVYLYKDGKAVDTLRPKLYEKRLSDNLSLKEMYLYHSHITAEPGREYRVEAVRDGFETAFGSDIAPAAVAIEDWQVDVSKKRISFSFEDAAAKGDYYMLEIVEEGKNGLRGTPFPLLSYDPRLEMLYSYGEIEKGGTTGLRAILRDETFNGERKEVVVHYDTTLTAEREYTFLFSHISESYYLNERSRAAAQGGDFLFFGEKANISGNVQGGYGSVVCLTADRRKFVP